MPVSITCQDCRKPAEVRAGTTKRCPACTKINASKSRAPNRPTRRRRRDGGIPARNEVLKNVRIWGIDGEGVNLPSGRHEYVYLCAVATDGETCELYHDDGRRLESGECLQFLWKLGKTGDLFVWYSSGYDWCHIFADVGLERLQSLYGAPHPLTDRTEYNGFEIGFLKNTVTLARHNGKRSSEKFFADVSRVFGAFPFVDFISKWDTGTPAERAMIAEMKGKRQDFTQCGPQERAYCQMECRHLAEGTRKMWQAMIGLNIVPAMRRMYSAGSLAKAQFRAHDVKDFSGPLAGDGKSDRYAGAALDSPVADALRRGYFGARIELAEPGPHKILHEFDLESAYPSVMATLPCVSHGHWEHASAPPMPSPRLPDDVQGIPQIIRVRWHARPGSGPKWGIFPWRTPDGTVLFPRRGEGWYWLSEVTAALGHEDYMIAGIESWTWVGDCDHRPFDWIPGTHADRKRFDAQWKAAGNAGKSPEGIVLKTALNSGYGTTADTVTEDPIFASLVLSLIHI